MQDEKWFKNKPKDPGHKKTLANFEHTLTIDGWNATALGRVRRFEGEDEERLPTRSCYLCSRCDLSPP